MLSSPSSLCASIRACSTRPCCSLATNQNQFQSFLDWNNWSTPGYLDPFETRLSKVKVKEKPPHQQPPAAREVPQQQLPESSSSITSLFSTSSWFSSGDDSFEYSPMASPPTPPPTLTPTNPFLPYLLSSSSATSSSEAALATVPEEEPSSSSLFHSYEPQDTTESHSETLNASYNPFFTWSKFTSLELLQLRCLALCFVVASSVWVIVQLSASI